MSSEIPWINGQKHGAEVRPMRGQAGTAVIVEIPWVNGQEHGTAVRRGAAGNVIEETRDVNGEEQPDP